jgi:predicted RNA-binding protein
MIRKYDFVDGLRFIVKGDRYVIYKLEFYNKSNSLWIFHKNNVIAKVDKITNTGFHWSKIYFETNIKGNHKFMDLTKV